MKKNVLPNHVFFNPTQEFISYLRQTANDLPLIDVGAGVGYLSRVLAANGFKVLAIDIYERDELLYGVVPLDATTMEFPSNCIPVMARPCHGEWVTQAIDNAMKYAQFMLYVGLPKNFDCDLWELYGRYQLTFESFQAGEDGEIVVRISKPTKF